ncbi:hypothetical protein EHI44_18630 [Rhizobium leguminosarum]|nr:hypothetical protein EHI44_18630 [Rhizobium leguminosarum]
MVGGGVSGSLPSRGWLPLTLTLSPLAGRGDVPCERSARNGEVAAIPLRPSGRRCRQADEGATRHALSS